MNSNILHSIKNRFQSIVSYKSLVNTIIHESDLVRLDFEPQ